MYRLIEKIRQQPLPVRQHIVFVSTIVVVMMITVAWFLGSFIKFSSILVEDQPEVRESTAASVLQAPYEGGE